MAHALVVDDEDDVRDLLMEILSDLGIRSSECHNGADGLEAAKREEFDIIFCDLRMPVMDGFGFLGGLKTERPDLVDRTVFVSGDLLQRSREQAEMLAGRITIEKPFEPADIRAVVETLLPHLGSNS